MLEDFCSLLTTRIHKRLTIENCVYVLSIADLYDARRLVDGCIDIIEEHFHEFYNSTIIQECLEHCSEYTALNIYQLNEDWEDMLKDNSKENDA